MCVIGVGVPIHSHQNGVLTPLLQCLDYALGAGCGFTLALVIMAGIREALDLADVPGVVKGAALSLIIAGILSLAFMGFAGLGG